MPLWSRRNFLKTGFAAGVLAGAGRLPLRAARGTATDWVTLGKSGVKVTRLAFGTGTMSGQIWIRRGCTRGSRKAALAGGSRDSYGLGDAREVRRQGDAARVRHRDDERADLDSPRVYSREPEGCPCGRLAGQLRIG